MFHRRPIGLSAVAADPGGSLARLNALEGFSRAILVGVVPILALQALGTKEAVAHMYLLAAIFTFCITLNFSTLERVLERRRVLTMAGLFLLIAAVLLYHGNNLVFAGGIGLRASAASLFSVCISLYIMEYITRNQLALTESRRMFYAGAAWLTGPFLGTWLWDQDLRGLPFLLSGITAALMITYFWKLRLGDNQVLTRKKETTVSPLKAVPRYFRQPRLRIVYFITLARAVFWASLFIYGPIYIIEAGLPSWMAGALLSFISGLLFLSPLIRRSAERFGCRPIIIVALIVCGIAMLSLGVLGKPQPIGVAFWICGALGGICLDVLGNIPFMRLVKPYERISMTMVFSTWREMSELLTPLLITLITLLFPFWVFYLMLGGALLIMAIVATKLPRRI